MPESSCHHVHASPVGYTEAPLERAETVVAGLVLFAGVYTCPDCGELVLGAYLHSRHGVGAELVSAGFTVLHPPADARRRVGEVTGRG